MMRCSISIVSVLFILMHTGVNQRGSGCLLLSPLSFVCVCVCFWSAVLWSAPHVFDITVTRLPSLSGEMENVRD